MVNGDVPEGAAGGSAAGGSSDETAWLDLVARFDAPVPGAGDDSAVPWPERENLAWPDTPGDGARAGEEPDDRATEDTAAEDTGLEGAAPEDHVPDDRVPEHHVPDDPEPQDPEPQDPVPGDTVLEGSALEGSALDDTRLDDPISEGPPGPVRVAPPGPAPDQRVIAGPGARDYSPPADPEDDHYVPPPPPPLPKIDPVTKVAWLALLGGPLYLLVATAVGWTVSGLAAFIAVAAFIGGFAALVFRMGNGGPGDSGPDDGAVV